jgi:hypothetical protein
LRVCASLSSNSELGRNKIRRLPPQLLHNLPLLLLLFDALPWDRADPCSAADENVLIDIAEDFFRFNSELIRMSVLNHLECRHTDSQLGGNMLSMLPAGLFSGLTFLEELWLWRNPFISLPPRLLLDQESLLSMSISSVCTVLMLTAT